MNTFMKSRLNTYRYIYMYVYVYRYIQRDSSLLCQTLTAHTEHLEEQFYVIGIFNVL